MSFLLETLRRKNEIIIKIKTMRNKTGRLFVSRASYSKNRIYDLRSLWSSHPLSGGGKKNKREGKKEIEREEKRIENLATIEKTASSHKIILINQTPLPVPCQCGGPRHNGEKCYRCSERQKE